VVVLFGILAVINFGKLIEDVIDDEEKSFSFSAGRHGKHRGKAMGNWE